MVQTGYLEQFNNKPKQGMCINKIDAENCIESIYRTKINWNCEHSKSTSFKHHSKINFLVIALKHLLFGMLRRSNGKSFQNFNPR